MTKSLCLVLGLVVSAAAHSTARADHLEERIRQCSSSDAVCVGGVLLEAIRGGSGGGSGPGLKIEFYRSDACDGSRLLGTMVFGSDSDANERNCRRRAQYISDSVWGIRIDGKCTDISDDSFLNACLKNI